MVENIVGKILGQLSGTGTLYTVPSGKSVMVTEIFMTNTGVGDTDYTIHIVPRLGVASNANLLANATIIQEQEFPDRISGLNLPLLSGDSIVVATSGNCTFQAFGYEKPITNISNNQIIFP